MLRPRISVIIPTLNEAEILPATLERLESCHEPLEILVVDGGSQDSTREVADRPGIRWLECPRTQRAAQMNHGARQARGDVLWFVHADTLVPRSGPRQVLKAMRRGALGGAFHRYFDLSSGFLRMTCRIASWRGHWTGWFLGDQAIFSDRLAFLQAGEFPDQDLFEDLELAIQLRRIGPTVICHPPVLSSGRRFYRIGPVRQTWSDYLLTWRYLRWRRKSPEHHDPSADPSLGSSPLAVESRPPFN